MRYRGFEITSTIDRGIIRHNYETGKAEIVKLIGIAVITCGIYLTVVSAADFFLARLIVVSDDTSVYCTCYLKSPVSHKTLLVP